MSTSIRLLTLWLGLGLVTTQSMASTRVAIYAIIEDITFEPSDFAPERVSISGVFVVPVPVSSGLHRSPSAGYLYFSLNPDAPNATRTDWKALQEAAGTGQVVGFGRYWTSCSNTRLADTPLPDLEDSNCSFEVSVHTDPGAAVPDPYPAPNSDGVVTVFDAHDDICPRFGSPSVQIIAGLREAHSPGLEQAEPPACVERIGLVPSSDLDSAFDTQTRDPDWAEAKETLILQRLAEAPGLELSHVGVECRDTICRIHLVFPTREFQEATGNRLVADALNELPGFARGGKIIPPRNEPVMDYYLQRKHDSGR